MELEFSLSDSNTLQNCFRKKKKSDFYLFRKQFGENGRQDEGQGTEETESGPITYLWQLLSFADSQFPTSPKTVY